MKIKMLIDFRGRETNEQFYQAGQVVEVDDQTAARLVSDKRAEYLEQKPEQTPTKGRRK